VNYDPFTFMRENNKVYGWVISMFEFEATIPTLWQRTKEFAQQNPQFMAEDNSLGWIVDGANVTKALTEKKIEGRYSTVSFSLSSSSLTSKKRPLPFLEQFRNCQSGLLP
jgi:hypothetical protein